MKKYKIKEILQKKSFSYLTLVKTKSVDPSNVLSLMFIFNSGVSTVIISVNNGSKLDTFTPLPKSPEAKFGFILYRTSIKHELKSSMVLFGHAAILEAINLFPLYVLFVLEIKFRFLRKAANVEWIQNSIRVITKI